MKKILSIIVFHLVFGICCSQSGSMYLSDQKSDEIYKKLKSHTKLKVKSLYGGFKKEEKKIYQGKLEYLKEILPDSIYLTNTPFNDKIDAVLNSLVELNPDLQKNTPIVLLNRNYSPNAASHGLNFIEINLGLFTILESEDELAFIICHEIAHEKLNHFNKTIKNIYDSYYSKKNKLKAREINKLESGKANAAIRELKKIHYNRFKNFRKHEIEADSLALKYYRNTSYSIDAVSSVLAKLGKYEENFLSQPVRWKEDYNIATSEFSLKKSFEGFKIIDTLFLVNLDSLKTHPNIQERISSIGTLDKLSTQNHTFSSLLNENQLKAFDLVLQTTKEHKEIVVNFYLNNFLFSLYPNNKQYLNNLIDLLNEVYSLKKNHVLGKYVSFTRDELKNKNLVYLKEIRDFVNNSELYHLKKIKSHLNQKK